MNKKYLLFVIFFVLGSVSGFSLDINLAKDAYSVGETLQAEILIDGKLEEDLTVSNVKLDCSGNFIDVAPSLFKIEEDHYYSYFDLGGRLGNCSFVLKDILYYESGFLERDSFEKNFELTGFNGSVITVSPAGARISDFSTEGSFEVYLENPYSLESINVSLGSSAEFIDLSEDSLLISSGGFKSFNVYISELLVQENKKEEITLSYDGKDIILPIWIFYGGSVTLENESSVDSPLLEFVMDVDSINVSLNRSNDLKGYIAIKNSGSDLSLIRFELTGNLGEVIDLQTSEMDSFDSGDLFKQYLFVNQNKDAMPGNYSGSLRVVYGAGLIEYPIFISVADLRIEEETNGISDHMEVIDFEENYFNQNGIGVWWFVLAFFVILALVIYFLYKRKNKKPIGYLKVF